MTSRFEHLKKNTTQSRLSRDEFIEGANAEKKSIQSKIKPSAKEILLSVSGRINREKSCGKPVLIYLKKNISESIQKYCHGNRTLIVNYLLERGLEALIQEGKLVLHMEEEE